MQKRIQTDGISGIDNPEENQNLYAQIQFEFSRSLTHVLNDYDKRIRPHDEGDDKIKKPLLVESTIAVTAFGPVSDQNGEFSHVMYVRMYKS